MIVSELNPLNALSFILLTDFGIVNDFNEVQLEKTLLPIVVTLSEIVTLFIFVKPLKIFDPIDVIPSSIITVVNVFL